MKKTLAMALLCCMLPTLLQAGRKKFIAHSWDLLQVPANVIVRNLPALEKLPLDGMSIRCYARDDKGATIPFTSGMTSPKWKREWCAYMLPDLKKICGGKFKDNLLSTFWAPQHRLDWTDDDAWERAAHNMGVAAWLARECGARGLLIDPEDYPQSRQYTYNPAVDKLPFAETCALARKRGAQMMAAIAHEYPDAVLLAFWFYSMHMNLTLQQNEFPRETLEADGILGVDFLNGMLDAMPPGMTMVDATENGYGYNAETYEFYTSACNIAKNFLPVIAPENRAKYRAQYQVGFGLYLDMYVNPENGPWYFPPLDGSRLKRMVANFTQAMDAADEYCWLYGEQCNWIDWDFGDFKGNVRPTWESKLPGFWDAITMISNKSKYLNDKFAAMDKAGTLVNLFPNAKAAPPAKKPGDKTPYPTFLAKIAPAQWGFWQLKPEGQFGCDTTTGLDDSFAARMTGMANGCFIVKAPAKAMENYAVVAYAKGDGTPSVRIRWQNSHGWCQQEKDAFFSFAEEAPNGWRRMRGIVTVPHGATVLVMLLSGSAEQNKSCYFDAPALYNIPLE